MSHIAPKPVPQSPAARLAPWAELAQRATQCGRMLRSRIAAHAAAEGLAEAEFFVLWACREPAALGKPQCDLAGELGVSPAQISGLVDRLQRQSLLAGRRDERDRRRQRWQPTSTGDALLERVLARLEPWLAATEVRLGHERVETLAAALDGLQQSLLSTGDEGPILRVVSPDGPRAEAAS